MKLYLDRSFFKTTETLLAETPSTKLFTFLYPSGVEAVRILQKRGEFIWLPFFGQSLWSWKVDGKEQKFTGFVEEPDYAARNFLHNYGAFMIHCGITAMGNPSKEDNHLHHGELPLARYQEAWIECSEGEYPTVLGGAYRYAVPFIASYTFSPRLSIAAEGTSVQVAATLGNAQQTKLHYLYLNHLNFSLEGAARLEYGLPAFTKKTVTVLQESVEHVIEDPKRFLALGSIHSIEPELVAIMKNEGQGSSVCVHQMHRDDGSRIWVAIDTMGLDHTVAWLTKTADRSACGFALPATGGPRGLAEETRQGTVKTLEPNEQITFRYVFGFDDSAQTEPLDRAVRMLGGSI
jgi:hypothetical protein